jgi:putative salt-induced outer membrane protein YdiY
MEIPRPNYGYKKQRFFARTAFVFLKRTRLASGGLLMIHLSLPRAFALFTITLFVPAFLIADVVTLKNGDRVTGSVVSSDAKVLKMKTEFLGEVEIQWEAVSSIDSPSKLYVTSGDGQTLVGPVKTDADKLEVTTAESGVVEAPLASVAAVRNQEAQDAYVAEIDRLRNPKLTDFWRGFFDSGLALTAGNAETTTFSNAAGATRETQRDKIGLYFTSVYAKAQTVNDETNETLSTTTANAIRGGTRYELNINPKVYTFGFLDLEFDEFQALDLRNVIGGGLGYHLIKNERTTFDVFGGASYNQEFFENDITRRSAEIVLGETLSYQVNGRTSLSERFALYPNMSDTGELRMQFDTSLTTDIFRWLGWNLTLSDRFLSNPVPGRQKNDVLLTTGIRMIFGNEKLR